MDEFALVARFSVAFTFLIAGIAKLPRRTEFERAVRRYGLTPEWLTRPIARFLPPFEVIAAFLLFTGLAIGPTSFLLAAALFAFAAAAAINLLRGRRIECGCLGISVARTITWWSVTRNLFLAATASMIIVIQPDAVALDAVFRGEVTSGISASDAVALLSVSGSAVLGSLALQEAKRLSNVLSLRSAER